MGWPGSVLPVFQQPLCSLPVLAVAMVLDMGELRLYERRLQRVALLAGGPGCMAVLVGPKRLALLQGDNVACRVAAVLLSLRNGNDSASADTRLTLDPLQLEL